MYGDTKTAKDRLGKKKGILSKALEVMKGSKKKVSEEKRENKAEKASEAAKERENK